MKVENAEGRKRRWDMYRECLRRGMKVHRGTKMRDMERMLAGAKSRREGKGDGEEERPRYEAPQAVEGEMRPVSLYIDRPMVERLGEAIGHAFGLSFGTALRDGISRAVADRRAKRAAERSAPL